jgi:hypothetical protein
VADQILKLVDLEDFFQSLTCACLGIPLADNTDPDNPIPINQDKVRIAWPKDGAPGWPITADVAFIRVINAGDDYTRLRNVIYTNGQRQVVYTNQHLVSWIFYGPNSYDNAEILRNALFLPVNMDLLSGQNLAPVNDFEPIQRSPELFNGEWWERSDWSCKFYEQVTRNQTQPSLASADIKIIRENGEVIEIDTDTTP